MAFQMDNIPTIAKRFLRYVTIDTQSDPQSTSSPSTEKQKVLSRLLYNELSAIGLKEVELDQYGYVYATIPATSAKRVPTLCFCAHIDTAPDCSGSDVRPIIHHNYLGEDIILPDDNTQVITQNSYSNLSDMIGEDIITASGKTLLGSDDKAGIAEIVDFAEYLVTHPEIQHGKIRILFTIDEEVGRGTENLDIKKVAADYAYTLDGGSLGTIEDQTFSADGVTVTIHGVSAHPGYAKGRMVNALKIAADLLSLLPRKNLSPETTDMMEGYIHPVSSEGNAEKCVVTFYIRDFDSSQLPMKERMLEDLVIKVTENYPKAHYEFKVKEQYRNMKEVLDQHPQIIEYAKEAINRVGLTPKLQSMRGGTDGSKLSFMGLPCANLFSGQNAIHSKHEFISVQQMQKVVQMMVQLVQVWEERTVK